MGVDLTIIGKHSIPFKGKEIKNKSKVIDLLNFLELEKSKFIREKCILWNSAHLYLDDWGRTFRKRCNKELERSIRIRSWKFEDYEEDDWYSNSLRYHIEGPFGLNLEINKYFFELSIFVGRYYHWFNTGVDFDIRWREKWRMIVHDITTILGGDFVTYFPDNAVELSGYLPTEFFYDSDEMSEKNAKKIKKLEHVLDIISEQYSKPQTLTEADKNFTTIYEAPFVIDRFENLNKTIKYDY